MCLGAGFVVVPSELANQVAPDEARLDAEHRRREEHGADRDHGGPRDPRELSDREQLELARKELRIAQWKARTAPARGSGSYPPRGRYRGKLSKSRSKR